MKPTNFNQLYYFWMTARERSVSAAARRLQLDQSTVSLQLKSLETSLGLALLRRDRHGAVPTPAGELALAYCDRIFSHAEELLGALSPKGGPGKPFLRVGVGHTAPRRAVLDLLREVQRLAGQDCKVRVYGGTNEDLSARLSGGMLDFAALDQYLAGRFPPAVLGKQFARVGLAFYGAPRLAERISVFPGGLEGIPMVARLPQSAVRKELDFYLYKNGIVPLIQAEVEVPYLQVLMLINGDGVGVFDNETVAPEVAAGRLVRIGPASLPFQHALWVYSSPVLGRGPYGGLAAKLKLGPLKGIRPV